MAEPRPDILGDRYELGPTLGQGGMGVVRQATDRRLGRNVAVKVLRADLAAQPEVRNRFEDEARAAARLTHHAVVTVFDSGEDGDTAYLVMECLSGRSLGDEMKEGPISPARARVVATHMLEALHSAHELGIIHRDVKPANILLTDDGRPKLADFGIAKMAEGLDHTSTGMLVGTPAYLAPERLSGAPASPASDIYSLAVVLYEALVGEKPYRGDTPMAVAMAMQADAPTPIAQVCPGIDDSLAAVIDGAMAPDPSARFSSAAEMLEGLDAPGSPKPSTETTRLDFNPATQVMAQPEPVWRETTTDLPIDNRGAWARLPIAQRLLVSLIALGVLGAILLSLRSGDGGDGAEGGSNTAPTAATTPAPAPETPLPAPLDDAIRNLEETVKP